MYLYIFKMCPIMAPNVLFLIFLEVTFSPLLDLEFEHYCLYHYIHTYNILKEVLGLYLALNQNNRDTNEPITGIICEMFPIIPPPFLGPWFYFQD